MENMEFVCNDVNGNTMWYFERETNRYHRFYRNGELRYSIHADNIADPSKIEEKGKTPQESTMKLWEHKNANLNA